MNTHPVANEDVMAYLDGELPAADAAEMAGHLAQCRTCQDAAADLQGVSRQLALWTADATEDEGVPAKVRIELELRLESKTKRPTSVRRWLFAHAGRMGAAAAALVIVLFAARVFLPPGAAYRALSKPEAPAGWRGLPVNGREMQLGDLNSVDRIEAPAPPGRLIVRTNELRLTTQNFDAVRDNLDRILSRFGGHIAQLDVVSRKGEPRSLTAVLRIPAPQLAAALGELRKLGRVAGESQRGDEVTRQSVDLAARLAHSRHTEQRLTEILRTQTGKLADVLAVEEKLAEIRGTIEQAEAEQKNLNNRVSLATVSLDISEDYRSPLSASLRAAAADGFHTAFDGAASVVHALLEGGPSLLLFALAAGLPAYLLWKKFGR